MLEWLLKALSSKDMPSTKRLGHFIGLSCGVLAVTVMLSILVGVSVNVPSVHYMSVYDSLLSAVIVLIGMMITGGTAGYIMTRNNENNKERKIE